VLLLWKIQKPMGERRREPSRLEVVFVLTEERYLNRVEQGRICLSPLLLQKVFSSCLELLRRSSNCVQLFRRRVPTES